MMRQSKGSNKLLIRTFCILQVLSLPFQLCHSWVNSGVSRSWSQPLRGRPLGGGDDDSSCSSAASPRRIIPDNVRVLILPGFGNDSDDYFLERSPQGSLVSSLRKCGWRGDQISVLPVKRSDWLNVFLRGAFDVRFWLADASPARPAFAWYLERIAVAVRELTAASTSEDDDTIDGSSNDDPVKVVLLGHSAGGWLARAAIGFQSLDDGGGGEGMIRIDDDDEASDGGGLLLNRSDILGMVTLGSPHVPPPPEVMDMTRGALRITSETFPGAYHSPDLFYVTVQGNVLRGVEQKSPFFEPTTPTGFAYSSYQAVCGDGTTVGDGVVPVCAGHLDDAIQLDLECFHSITNPDNWYGSDTVIGDWHDTMLREIIDRLNKSRSAATALEKQPNLINSLENLFRR